MSCSFATTDSPQFRPGERSIIEDERGVPVSCSHRQALVLYEKALVQFQSYVGDPVTTIEEALKHAPDFVLGHALRALVLMTFGEQRFAERARVSVASAEVLLGRAHPRERDLVMAARALVDREQDLTVAERCQSRQGPA